MIFECRNEKHSTVWGVVLGSFWRSIGWTHLLIHCEKKYELNWTCYKRALPLFTLGLEQTLFLSRGWHPAQVQTCSIHIRRWEPWRHLSQRVPACVMAQGFGHTPEVGRGFRRITREGRPAASFFLRVPTGKDCAWNNLWEESKSNIYWASIFVRHCPSSWFGKYFL